MSGGSTKLGRLMVSLYGSYDVTYQNSLTSPTIRPVKKFAHEGTPLLPKLVASKKIKHRDGHSGMNTLTPIRQLSSNGEAVVNLYSNTAGGTMLTLPFAIIQSGIIPGLIVFLAVTGLSVHCCNIATRMMNMCKDAHGKNYKIKGFEEFDVGSPRFQSFVNFVVQLDFTFGAAITISMMAITLDGAGTEMFGNEPYHYYRTLVLIVTLVLLPTVWIKHFNGLATISMMGTIANAIVMCVIVIDAYFALHSDKFADAERPLYNHGPFASIGTLTYLYGITTMMPTFREDMKKPKDLNYVHWLVHAMCVVTYGCIIGMSPFVIFYLLCSSSISAYGDKVQSPVSLSFVVPGFTTVVALCMVVSLFSSTALQLVPPGIEIEDYFQKHYPTCMELKVRLIGRTFLMIFATGIALISPRIDILFNFVGSVTTSCVQVTFPQVFLFLMHRKFSSKKGRLYGEHIPLYVWAISAFAFVWGIFSTVYGVYSSYLAIATGQY